MIIDLDTLTPMLRQDYLQHAIAPRPIALVSSMNDEGQVNLSPFSFFNLFSTTPPMVIFSPARRVRDNTTKHSLQNAASTREVVINIVDENIVQQVSLASCEYGPGVNEFIKAGFTMEPASLVKPPLVKESKINLECRVKEIISLGNEGGAGNLVLCEIFRMHINDEILDEQGKIDQLKLQHVARLGGDWYCRVNEQSLFKVPKPNTQLGIGFDQLPENIRMSKVFTGNDLAQLANVTSIPDASPSFSNEDYNRVVQYFSLNPSDMELELHKLAAKLIGEGKIEEAWQVLL